MRKILAMTFIMGLAATVMMGPVCHAQDLNEKGLRVTGATTASDEVKIWAEEFTQANLRLLLWCLDPQ